MFKKMSLLLCLVLSFVSFGLCTESRAAIESQKTILYNDVAALKKAKFYYCQNLLKNGIFVIFKEGQQFINNFFENETFKSKTFADDDKLNALYFVTRSLVTAFFKLAILSNHYAYCKGYKNVFDLLNGVGLSKHYDMSKIIRHMIVTKSLIQYRINHTQELSDQQIANIVSEETAAEVAHELKYEDSQRNALKELSLKLLSDVSISRPVIDNFILLTALKLVGKAAEKQLSKVDKYLEVSTFLGPVHDKITAENIYDAIYYGLLRYYPNGHNEVAFYKDCAANNMNDIQVFKPIDQNIESILDLDEAKSYYYYTASLKELCFKLSILSSNFICRNPATSKSNDFLFKNNVSRQMGDLFNTVAERLWKVYDYAKNKKGKHLTKRLSDSQLASKLIIPELEKKSPAWNRGLLEKLFGTTDKNKMWWLNVMSADLSFSQAIIDGLVHLFSLKKQGSKFEALDPCEIQRLYDFRVYLNDEHVLLARPFSKLSDDKPYPVNDTVKCIRDLMIYELNKFIKPPEKVAEDVKPAAEKTAAPKITIEELNALGY